MGLDDTGVSLRRERVSEYRSLAKFAFDFEKPIVFRDPLTPAKRASLDLPAIHCDCKIGDKVSSVSPERCEMMNCQPAALHNSIASIVSVTVPI